MLLRINFMTIFGMGHVCDFQLLHTKHILLDSDVIFYKYYKIKFYDVLEVSSVFLQVGRIHICQM